MWSDILNRMWKAIQPDSDLPLDLLIRVAEVARLIELCGGELASRQIIAVIVEQYLREDYNAGN